MLRGDGGRQLVCSTRAPGRHGYVEPAARLSSPSPGAGTAIVGDVLDVEQPHRVEVSRRIGVGQRCADDGLTACFGVRHAGRSGSITRLDPRRASATIRCNSIAIGLPAELLHGFDDEAVAVVEPERLLLDGKAEGVGLVRNRWRSHCKPPDASASCVNQARSWRSRRMSAFKFKCKARRRDQARPPL